MKMAASPLNGKRGSMTEFLPMDMRRIPCWSKLYCFSKKMSPPPLDKDKPCGVPDNRDSLLRGR